jgi:hypothetical protein
MKTKKSFSILNSAFCIFLMFFVLNVQAQKVTQGSLKFLKGETTLKIAFDYSAMKVNGKTEQAYVEAEVTAKNNKEAGSGDQWKTEWEAIPARYFEPAVVDYFNQKTDGTITVALDADANYLATVKTLQLTTGYMAGPMSKPAVVTVQVVFTKVGSSEALATVEVKNARTNGFNLSKYVLLGERVGSAYSYVGQNLALAVLKAVK